MIKSNDNNINIRVDEYVKPEIDIIYLSADDIIRTSGSWACATECPWLSS